MLLQVICDEAQDLELVLPKVGSEPLEYLRQHHRLAAAAVDKDSHIAHTQRNRWSPMQTVLHWAAQQACIAAAPTVNGDADH